MSTIYCEKQSHKGMIFGKNGEMLKKNRPSGSDRHRNASGEEGLPPDLVKVKENWRDNQTAIRNSDTAIRAQRENAVEK
jgi:GTP-binding protein Era